MKGRKKLFLFIMIVVTILSAVAIVLSANGHLDGGKLYSAVSVPVKGLQKAFSGISNAIGSRVSLLKEYDSIAEEIDTLREENDRLAYVEEERDSLKKENEELRGLLGMKEDLVNYKLIGARVIANDVSDWYNDFTVNRGARDGISAGDVVITSHGLVGIVSVVGTTTSKVRCIVDDQSTVMGRVSGSNELVRVRGTTNENYNPGLVADRISADSEIKAGDTVVTAESGGVYPKGIMIGTVTAVGTDSDGHIIAEIEPAVNCTTLISVSVLLEEKAQGPDRLD